MLLMRKNNHLGVLLLSACFFSPISNKDHTGHKMEGFECKKKEREIDRERDEKETATKKTKREILEHRE